MHPQQRTQIRNWATAIAVALSTATAPAFAEGTTAMSQDQQNVLDLVQKMTNSFEAGDIEAVMQTYEAHQTIMFEPGQPVSDGATAKHIFGQAAAISPKFSYSGHEVIVEGDLAIHIAPWEMLGTDPEGNEVNGKGLSIAVLRRQPGGAWKMVIDNPHGSRLLSELDR